MKLFRIRTTITALVLLIAATLPARAQIASHIDRSEIADIDTVLYKTEAQNIVTITGSFPAGSRFSPATNPAVAIVTAAMIDQGTTQRDKFAIADQLETVGASLTFSASGTMVNFNGKCLTKDAPLLLALLAEQLRTPAFSPEEFAKAKTQLIGNYQRARENTDARASYAFTGILYPIGHPNYTPSIDAMLKALDTITLEDVKAFHAAYYGPAQFTLVAVGDLDTPSIKAAVARAFTGWTGGRTFERASGAPATASSDFITVAMPDKTSVSIILGQRSGLKYGEPDHLALITATAILGSGFTGRLLANVRDREGLTYGIGARLRNDTYTDGEWAIVATFAPALLDQGIASTRRQLDAWYDKGVSAEELEARKSNLIGSFKVELATTEGMASQILATLNRGQPLTAIDDYPATVNALTLEQVNASIKKYLNPAHMTLIQAGTLPEK